MSIGLLFLFFALILAIGVPISITLAIISFLPHLFDSSFAANAAFLIRQMVGGVDSYPILAIPMFILSGVLMAKGGISEKLFNVFAYFLAKRTAGLPCAVVITCLFYGAISGSGPATVAAVGSMTIPILVSLGYDMVFVTALVAVAGGLGVIIPPSIPFILFGMSSGASVGSLFLAGIIPGLLIGGCLMIYAWFHCKKHGEDKEKLMAHHNKLHSQGFVAILKDSFWALLSPVIILGSIYGGFATPTEAAVISVVYSLIISLFLYRTLKISDLIDVMDESIKTYTGLFFILAAAVAFGRVLAMMQAPQMVAALMTSSFSSKVAILLVINLFLLFVGMVMDTSPAILILTPILIPITNSIGVDPIHFGIIMVVNLAIGFVTPPMGINLFVASSLTKVPVMKISRAAMPFIVAFLIALVFITFIPALSLMLV